MRATFLLIRYLADAAHSWPIINNRLLHATRQGQRVVRSDPLPGRSRPSSAARLEVRIWSEQRLASVALLTRGSRAEAPRGQFSLSLLPITPAISYGLRRRHSYL